MGSECGLGPCFRPAWLQRLATPFSFLAVYGLLGTTQAMAFIYFVATLTTVEKRFKIPSRTAGFLMSGNEISQILLSLILSYYGGQGNRPLWIATGVTFTAMSCFILSLPHAIYGPGDDALALTQEYGMAANTSNLEYAFSRGLCTLTSNEMNCEDGGGGYATMPLALIFVSQFVLGIGTTLYYALGQTYLDDNTKKSKTPLMLGCVFALRTVGPAFGFMLGFICLSLYIDPSLTPIIEKNDPRWLGAWWLGWVILGCIKLVVALLIALFPKELPKRQEIKSSEEQPLKNSSITKEISSSLPKVNQQNGLQEVPSDDSGFIPSLKRLLRNKLLMSNNLSTVFYILGASGYITFMMKYLETQFQQAAARATGFLGTVGISAMVMGFLISGIVLSRFKPRALYVLSWNIFTGLCYVVCEIVFIFIKCPENGPRSTKDEFGEFNLRHECNENCICSHKYSPVCHRESETTFYSACYAGCTTISTINGTESFSDCSCTASLPSIFNAGAPSLETDVISGPCSMDCTRIFVTFLLIQFFMHLIGNTGKIGNVLVTYRCVKQEDKSFAQGLTLFMVSLFAFIPGPILYGAIIDSTCLVWEESCQNKGNCWLYDSDKFRLYINLTAACLTFIGVALDVLVCILGRNLELYEEAQPPDNKLTTEQTR